MKRSRTIAVAAMSAFGLILAGCRSAPALSHSAPKPQVPAASSEIRQASYEDEAAADAPRDADDPFVGLTVLSVEAVVSAVQSRNPSIQAASAAWSAAAQKYPQAVALDDPTFQSMLAPRSLSGASNVPASFYVGVAQPLTWPGKRELRGNQANWESAAAMYDYSEVQVHLAESARLAFFDYFLSSRLRELNSANRVATGDFRRLALSRYEANLASQNDVLQADVEIAKLEQKQIEIEQDRAVAIARLNTLMHRRPEHPLPEPLQSLTTDNELPSLANLQQTAEQNRPELQALAARVQAEMSAIAIACKEYYPDFEVMARYDQFWFEKEQQPQLGLNMNVPLNRSKRAAAVREAQARAAKAQAEYEQARDTLRNDIASAYARTAGSDKSIRLFETKLLPTAKQNLETAQAGYEAGTLDFLRVIEAQRQVIELREQRQMQVVELHRRRTVLERAVGTGLAHDLPNSSGQ